MLGDASSLTTTVIDGLTSSYTIPLVFILIHTTFASMLVPVALPLVKRLCHRGFKSPVHTLVTVHVLLGLCFCC
jgi:hypothetical protein